MRFRFPLTSSCLSLFSAIPLDSAVHEGGHYLTARTLGENPELGVFGDDWAVLYITSSSDISDKEMLFTTLGGPAAEYSVALALAYIGRKIDRTKHRLLKETTKFASSFMSWAPFGYCIANYVTPREGDYQILSELGLPYLVTLPATFLAGTAVTYYNFKEKVPTLGDTINDTQKKELKQYFVQELDRAGYTPGLLDKGWGKLKRKSPIDVRAEKLCRDLFGFEVLEKDGEPYYEGRIDRLYKALGSKESITRLANEYLPIKRTEESLVV